MQNPQQKYQINLIFVIAAHSHRSKESDPCCSQSLSRYTSGQLRIYPSLLLQPWDILNC